MKIGTKITCILTGAVFISLGATSIIACAVTPEAAAMKSIMAGSTIVLTLVCALICHITIKNSVSRPIKRLTDITRKIAEGDVDVPIEIEGAAEITDLMKACESMIKDAKTQNEWVEKLIQGDFFATIIPRSNKDVRAFRMMALTDKIKSFITEMDAMANEAEDGKIGMQINEEGFNGCYKNTIRDFNRILRASEKPLRLVGDYLEKIGRGDIPELIEKEAHGDDKINSGLNSCIEALRKISGDADLRNDAAETRICEYEMILDAVPFPVSVTDMDMNWIFINKAAEELAGMTRAEAIGRSCRGMNTEICGTDACSINCLKEGKCESAFTKGIQHFQVSADHLLDKSGEQIGYIEVIQDDTIIIEADKYSGAEVKRLAKNLGDLSRGLLDLDFNVGEGNEYTVTERQNFTEINSSLKVATEGIYAMVEDVKTLAEQAVKGDLSYRADESKHGGDFANIMNGVNRTLDAVIAPINEASAVLQEMAKGNLSVAMEGDYQGDHAAIKEALNTTIDNIRSYISEIGTVLEEIGNGNLDQTITADYKGDFIAIKDSLNNISISLSQILGEINRAADQVASGAHQVSDASQSLSQGSTEQASTLQELTASITEIANQTKQNAVNANQANDLADAARENSEKGNVQMKGMLRSMVEIDESSTNISKIIKVIDDIAFQTNILALNAAVEAARAGQYGKGFAVVAEEVRSLAAKSAEAAKETTALIEGSISKVESGTKLANATASALSEIADGNEKSAALVANIANASNEQASGIAQINLGIEQVSVVVQNNSATAEEAAASSEELSGQAELLKEMVGGFRLRKDAAESMFESAKLLGGSKPERTPLAVPIQKRSEIKPRIEFDNYELDKY